MKRSMLSAFLISALSGVNAIEVAGVAPSDQHLYQPDSHNTFGCLSDPSIRIPFSQVNDDYCDCPDGSDEPGTSACSNGKFWCAGSGQYIPSRIVGDGVCDYEQCCDGSDEAPGLCEDRCAEVKAKLAEKKRREREFLEEGARLRAEMVSQAQARKQELEQNVETLKSDIEATQNEISELKARLAQAEQEDAEGNADPESAQAVVNLRSALKETDSLQELMYERFVALKEAYKVLDEALSTMSVEYNPNFNDPAVKAAIKTWKAHAAPLLSFPATRNIEEDIDQLDRIKLARVDDVEPEEESGGWKSVASNLLPPLLAKPLLSSSRSNTNSLTGPRAQKVRESLDELNSKLSDLERQLKLDSNLLAVGPEFWGPDSIGRSSEELCVSIKRGDFNYEACLFGTAVQLDGVHQVHLGRSTGLKENGTIEFVGGNRCPNGKERSLTLYLECGHDTEAYTIEEPEVCHYVAKAKSPLMCFPPGEEKRIVHDEL